MAVKKNVNKGPISWEDVFDTQEALDSGILGSVTAGTETKVSSNTGFYGVGSSRSETSGDYQANKDDFGSMLILDGMSASTAIDANKKRKKEQEKTRQAGFGGTQSILGGSGF